MIDERIVEADSAGVHERSLRDVELGATGPLERRDHLIVQGIQLGALAWADADCIGEEEVPESALAEEPGDLADHVVEAWNRAQRIEGRAVRGMFPRQRRDAGKRDARHETAD